jgi:hypothetical protein
MSSRPPDAPDGPLHDPAFDAAWRAASTEMPSPAQDTAILAAARRAVDAGPRRVPEAMRPERWWWPLAAAATIGAIAIGILQLGAPDKDGARTTEVTIATDMPAAPAQAPTAITPPLPARERDARADAGADIAVAPDVVRKASVPPSATRNASAPVPAAAKPIADEAAPAQIDAVAPAPAPRPFPAGAAERREMAAGETSSSAAPATGKLAADAGSAARAQQRAPLPIAEWLTLIRKLRAEGRSDEAARELAAFRLAYPEEARRLPDDLRDWRPAEQ